MIDSNSETYDELEFNVACLFPSFVTWPETENVSDDDSTDQKFPKCVAFKLKETAIVKIIQFKRYVELYDNLKEFQIFGGLFQDTMMLLLEGNIKNDSEPQTFTLRHTFDNGEKIPILYLKIVPHISYDARLILSNWYIQLFGEKKKINLAEYIDNNNMIYEEVKKLSVERKNDKALQSKTNVNLEHIIHDLRYHLVHKGNFLQVEKLVEDCINKNLMDDYLNEQKYNHTWKLQETKSAIRPENRGGHQLIMDSKNRVIYLFGGWNGTCDLNDLWCFDIETSTWTLIHYNSDLYNGPTPRSCHKMVFDTITEKIFILGKYLNNLFRTPEYIQSDFFSFDTKTKEWTQICEDTSKVNGPNLIYDHQMCFDAKTQTIYVFGGKILTQRTVLQERKPAPKYSGLFSYHIPTNEWKQLLTTPSHSSAASSSRRLLSIEPRATHCMVFHEGTRKIYIYDGQNENGEIDSLISYNVDTNQIYLINENKDENEIITINSNNDNNNRDNSILLENRPSKGFTLRATIDCKKDEIYIFSSLTKEKNKNDSQQIDTSSNSFWVYSLTTDTWTQIYKSNYRHCDFYSTRSDDLLRSEPCPRYAHQIVYDDVSKTHYLFGGNPCKISLPQLRLDDFWILLLQKPQKEELLHHCRYLIRELRYKEMTRINPEAASKYLQQKISEIVDHENPNELENFHKLSTFLFKSEDDCAKTNLSLKSTKDQNRNENEKNLNDDATCDNKINLVDNTDVDMMNNVRSETRTTPLPSTSRTTTITLPPSPPSPPSPPPTATIDVTEKFEIPIDKLLPLHDHRAYNAYKNWGGKKTFNEYFTDIKVNRIILFETITQFMSSDTANPKSN